MIEKPLMIMSIIFSLLGFNSLSDKYDAAVARIYSGDTNKVLASSDIHSIGFPDIIPVPTVIPFVDRPEIFAKHYLIGDATSGKVILKSNTSEQVPIASTTKIMTAILAIENYDLDEIITVSQMASEQIGSDVFLRPGEQMTVNEMLYCLMLKSGNDSAYALAEHMSLNNGIDEFVQKMNKKAQILGMKNTHFKDPAGLDISGYASADDMFILTRYALNNTIFREITSSAKYTAKNTTGTIFHPLENSNRLVNEYQYMGAIGVKTGYMPEAGHCLISAVEREGHILIGIVFNTNADNATASADESRKLHDWAWNNIEWK